MRAVVVAMMMGLVSIAMPIRAQEAPAPAPQIPNGAWKDALREHPRLPAPKAFLKALAEAKPEMYKEIKGSEILLAAGVVHAIEGIPNEQVQKRIEDARKHVAAGVTNVHQDTWIALNDTALTYDFFFDSIAPDERQKWIEWMNAHIDAYKDDEGAFHNSTLSKVLCYLHIAYATWGENPRAKDFRDYAIVNLYEGKLVPVLNEFGAGGGFTECGWYSRGSLWHLVEALELARRMEGYDGFQKAPKFFYQRLAYEIYQPYPGLGKYGAEVYAVEGDGSGTYGGHREYPRHMRTLLAQYFRGSELARYTMAKRRRASSLDSRLIDFLYEEEGETPLELAALPLAHLASGIGRVYARSDWTDDATWLRFECGDYWNGHQHFEVGNFEIFRYEPLATESGEYADYLSNHDVNWLLRTIAHNCILVNQPDEQWKRLRDGGRNKYANDGGQAQKWEWTVGDLETWKQRRDQFDRGDVVAYQNQPEFLYVAGDCTKAYAPTKLSHWVRQIVFLRPGTFVIFDRVISTKPEYEKTWLLHCRNQPEIDGAAFNIQGDKGRLVAQTLLPEKPVIHKIKGYTYGGQTFDPKRSSQTDVANKWRIEVLPSEPNTEDIFLHVLSTGEPQKAELIRKDGVVGVRVGESEVMFNGEVGGALSLAGKKFDLKAEVVKGKHE